MSLAPASQNRRSPFSAISSALTRQSDRSLRSVSSGKRSAARQAASVGMLPFGSTMKSVLSLL